MCTSHSKPRSAIAAATLRGTVHGRLAPAAARIRRRAAQEIGPPSYNPLCSISLGVMVCTSVLPTLSDVRISEPVTSTRCIFVTLPVSVAAGAASDVVAAAVLPVGAGWLCANAGAAIAADSASSAPKRFF